MVTGGGRRRPARAAAYAALTVLGLLIGVAGSLVQAGWFPLGLLLALAGETALLWGGALLLRSRAGAAFPAGGWALGVLPLTVSRAQGDFVFAAEAGSYVFLLGGMAIASLSAALAPADRPLFAVPEPRPREH